MRNFVLNLIANKQTILFDSEMIEFYNEKWAKIAKLSLIDNWDLSFFTASLFVLKFYENLNKKCTKLHEITKWVMRHVYDVWFKLLLLLSKAQDPLWLQLLVHIPLFDCFYHRLSRWIKNCELPYRTFDRKSK